MNATSSNPPLVMVVEDDLMIAATLEIALESRNYRVLGPVATLEEAYPLIEKTLPDVALIDYRLATSTTEELATLLRERDVPTCVLTGLSIEELPLAYAHCTVLQKPFRLNALIEMLERITRP